MDKFKPDYYKTGGMDVIEFCQRQELSFSLGNVVKYVCRAGRKGSETALDDLKKAREYIDREIEWAEQGQTVKEQLEFFMAASPNAGSGGLGGVGHRADDGSIRIQQSSADAQPIQAAPVEELERVDRPVTYLDKLNETLAPKHKYETLKKAVGSCPSDFGWPDIGSKCEAKCIDCWLRPYEEAKHD